MEQDLLRAYVRDEEKQIRIWVMRDLDDKTLAHALYSLLIAVTQSYGKNFESLYALMEKHKDDLKKMTVQPAQPAETTDD